jgi:PAS domain S-box-containing protein/diguanylate cyclase (GGDEF)-like protein
MIERRSSQQAARNDAEKFRARFESTGDCVYIHDLEGNFLDMNSAALKMLGYGRDEIRSLNIDSLLGLDQASSALRGLRKFEAPGLSTEHPHFRLRVKSGAFVDVETTIAIVPYEGSTQAVLGIARDITAREQELPDRHFIEEHMANLMCSQDSLVSFALAYIDIDQFKGVNAAFLRTAATRLRSALQEHDVLARIEGDRFVAVLAGVNDRNDAVRAGRALLQSLECNASIGIAMFPEDASTIDDLMRSADTATHCARTGDRNQSIVSGLRL